MALDLPLEEIHDIPANKIVFVQLADAPKMNLDLRSWSRHHRCFPGQGNWNMEGFYQAIEKTKFDGWISHEIFNDEYLLVDPKEIALAGIKSLQSNFG